MINHITSKLLSLLTTYKRLPVHWLFDSWPLNLKHIQTYETESWNSKNIWNKRALFYMKILFIVLIVSLILWSFSFYVCSGLSFKLLKFTKKRKLNQETQLDMYTKTNFKTKQKTKTKSNQESRIRTMGFFFRNQKTFHLRTSPLFYCASRLNPAFISSGNKIVFIEFGITQSFF